MPSSSTSSSSSTTAMQTTAVGNYKANPSLLCAGFNQDATCISVGSRRGYSITNCDPFGKVYARCEYPLCLSVCLGHASAPARRGGSARMHAQAGVRCLPMAVKRACAERRAQQVSDARRG